MKTAGRSRTDLGAIFGSMELSSLNLAGHVISRHVARSCSQQPFGKTDYP